MARSCHGTTTPGRSGKVCPTTGADGGGADDTAGTGRGAGADTTGATDAGLLADGCGRLRLSGSRPRLMATAIESISPRQSSDGVVSSRLPDTRPSLSRSSTSARSPAPWRSMRTVTERAASKRKGK